MKKTVLLARPSFFIVNDMKKFIANNGYDPRPLKSIKQIDQIPVHLVSGVVISNAISSDVDETYMEVVKAIRNVSPKLPIAFATLVDFDVIKRSIKMNLETLYDEPIVTNIDNYNTDSMNTSTDQLFLVLHKDDISKADREKKANDIITRHFR